MKKLFVGLCLFSLLLTNKVQAITTGAKSVILMDQDSKRILYQKNINEVRSVASISKIMTGILACESGKLDKKIKVGSEIDKAYGSGIYIKKGEVMTIRDLTYGLMLRSGNDAALALAKNIGGSVDQFVKMMNKKAQEIGMNNTTFYNPSGLDEDKGNYSTSYDMAILTSYAMKNKDYRKIVATKNYKLSTNMNTYSWTNKNKLLRLYKYTTGGKTGFTKIARRTLVSTASKDNLNLVIVTLNDGNDFNDHKNLYEEYFNKYHSYSILNKGIITINDDKYYKNKKLYIKNDIKYPLREDEEDLIKIEYHLDKNKKISGKVGNVEVMLSDKKILSEPIYIKEHTNNKNKKRKWFKLW